MSAQNEGFHDEVEGLVRAALKRLQQPYGSDVIEDVLLMIEQSPNLMRHYQQLCVGHDQATVNRRIGMLTRAVTGYKAGKSVTATRTGLSKTYTVLIPFRG